MPKLGISITRSATEAYEFLSLPENFAKWLWGSGAALRQAGADWLADTAEGRVTVCLSERNSYGVLDYSVKPPSGMTVYVPLRVVAKHEGCDLVLTLFRQPDVPEEKFADTAERVMRELLAAKRILEAQ